MMSEAAKNPCKLDDKRIALDCFPTRLCNVVELHWNFASSEIIQLNKKISQKKKSLSNQSNQINSNQFKINRFKSNQIRSIQINSINSNQFKSIQINSNQFNSIQINWNIIKPLFSLIHNFSKQNFSMRSKCFIALAKSPLSCNNKLWYKYNSVLKIAVSTDSTFVRGKAFGKFADSSYFSRIFNASSWLPLRWWTTATAIQFDLIPGFSWRIFKRVCYNFCFRKKILFGCIFYLYLYRIEVNFRYFKGFLL